MSRSDLDTKTSTCSLQQFMHTMLTDKGHIDVMDQILMSVSKKLNSIHYLHSAWFYINKTPF